MSLRARLVYTVSVVALLALLAADFVTYGLLRTFLYNQVDATLQSGHIAIEASLTGAGPRPAAQGGEEGERPARAGAGSGRTPPTGSAFCGLSYEGDAPGAFVELRTAGGSVVAGDRCPAFEPGGTSASPLLPARIVGFQSAGREREPTAYFTAAPASSGGPQFRVRASILVAGRYRGDELVVALPLSSTTSTLDRLLRVELAVTGGALVVALLLGWWLVRLELAPLRRVESTAEAIADGDLSHRVPGENARTEVGQVARALNTMLEGIEQAFAAREAAAAELRASEERLRRFVADASHELRTPLAAVSAYAQLLARGEGGDEERQRQVDGIRRESSRMAQLVEDLLLLARLDEHRPLRRQQVELVDLASGAIETAGAVGAQWPVRLEASEAVEVLGDRMQLRQVLDNLLANVREHTPPGTAAVVRVRRRGDEALLEVADEGPGMSEEQAERVFERFFRADPSRARGTGGAGLGLAIVAAIAEAHGGGAGVSSRPGEGTTVTVHLPLAPPEDEEPAAPETAEPAPPAGEAPTARLAR